MAKCWRRFASAMSSKLSADAAYNAWVRFPFAAVNDSSGEEPRPNAIRGEVKSGAPHNRGAQVYELLSVELLLKQHGAADLAELRTVAAASLALAS
jgi:hypothetical protein